MAKQTKKTTKKRKVIRKIYKGIIFIQSSFNNAIVTIADDKGNALSWSTAGAVGFSGTKKSTPFAAQTAVKEALEKAKGYEIDEAIVKISGVGSGREAAVRAIGGHGIKITQIKDVTPMPHNGCRPKKVRRV